MWGPRPWLFAWGTALLSQQGCWGPHPGRFCAYSPIQAARQPATGSPPRSQAAALLARDDENTSRQPHRQRHHGEGQLAQEDTAL